MIKYGNQEIRPIVKLYEDIDGVYRSVEFVDKSLKDKIFKERLAESVIENKKRADFYTRSAANDGVFNCRCDSDSLRVYRKKNYDFISWRNLHCE